MLPELAKHSEKLSYFYAIVSEGSLQATSRKLGISASGLSYTLKELEKVCGVALLKRSKKGIAPTEAGETLYQLCRKIYRDMEQAQRQMTDADHEEVRRIRIGTFPSIAIYFWPMLLKELSKESQLSMSITTGRSKEILERLIKQEVDVAITVECFTHAQLLKHELYSDTFGFYVSSKKGNSPLEEQSIYYIPDAEDQDGKKLRQYLHGMDIRFKEECEMDSFEVIGQFVRNGHGVGILPNKVAATFGKAIKRVPQKTVLQNFGPHRFYLSYRNDLGISQKSLEQILSAAKKAVAGMR